MSNCNYNCVVDKKQKLEIAIEAALKELLTEFRKNLADEPIVVETIVVMVDDYGSPIVDVTVGLLAGNVVLY